MGEELMADHSEVRDGVVVRPDGLKHLSPERASALLGLIRAGEKLDRELSRDLEVAHGLSLRGFEVLLFLAVFSTAGSRRLSDLTAQAPLSQSRMSRLVADLEARGLVERAGVPGDARAAEITITTAGRELFKAAQETHLEDLERRLFSRLSGREIAQLARITAKVLAEE